MSTTPNQVNTAARMLTLRYPFTAADGKEVTDAQRFFHAFAGIDDGLFPLGVNGFPHGGVHFAEPAAKALNLNAGVRCLAEGDIVAYKLDREYPHLHFTQDGRWALYSTGFVLMRHVMQLPTTAGATEDSAAPTSQTFFSLYMHLADWTGYLADSTLKRPGWWPGISAFRVGHADHQAGGGVAGGRVRTEPRAVGNGRYRAGALVGFLPQNCEFTISERRGPWGHIQAIHSGRMISPTHGGLFGGDDDLNGPWYRPYGAPADAPVTPQGDWGWIYLPEQHAVTEPCELDAVVVLDEPIHVKAGELLGHLGQYLLYERTTTLPPRRIESRLHLEVFADAPFPAFLAQCRAYAAKVPDEQKTLMVVPAGTRLALDPPNPDCTLREDVIRAPIVKVTPTANSPAKGRWIKVTPYYRDPLGDGPHAPLEPGRAVWIERDQLATATAETRAWREFPLSTRRLSDTPSTFDQIFSCRALDNAGGRNYAQDDKGNGWCQIELTGPEGSPVDGWIETRHHPGTTRVSPWAWPGFEVVDATELAMTDAFKRKLVVVGSATPMETYKWKGTVARVDASPLFHRLAELLEPCATRNGKPVAYSPHSVVTARAMYDALLRPGMAQTMSRLILRFDSEWSGNMARWEAITPMMRNARENWECELQRIRALQWWPQVRGKVEGFPESSVVYHVNPIAWVENFKRDVDVLAAWIKRIGDIISDGEGTYESYNTGIDRLTGRVAHSFRNPPAGTITKKTINEIIASNKLPPSNTSRFFASGKYQVVTGTMQEGKKKLSLDGEELFDDIMQERFFTEYLFEKAGQGKLAAFVLHGVGTVNDAQLAAAKEWASIGVPEGLLTQKEVVSDGQMSYYEGKANSANKRSTKLLREVLTHIDESR